MTRLEAAVKWRERYPDRAAELRSTVRRYLGMGMGQDGRSDFARKACEVAEAELLGIVYGLPEDPSPMTEAKKALDLEEVVPLTGRDRAAGARDD